MRAKFFNDTSLKSLEAKVNTFAETLEDGGVTVSGIRLSPHFSGFAVMITYQASNLTTSREDQQ